MITGDVRLALRIAILADDREGPVHALGPRLALVGSVLDVDAASDELGDRDAEALRPLFEVPMLRGRELYLNTHHDGITIPSAGDAGRRKVAGLKPPSGLTPRAARERDRACTP